MHGKFQTYELISPTYKVYFMIYILSKMACHYENKVERIDLHSPPLPNRKNSKTNLEWSKVAY
jgi:hypothetical protein